MRVLVLALLLLSVPLSGCLVGPGSEVPQTVTAMLEELDNDRRDLPLRGALAIERSEPRHDGFRSGSSLQIGHHSRSDDALGDGQAYAWSYLRRSADAYSIYTATSSGWTGYSSSGMSTSPLEPFLMQIDGGAPVADGWMDSDEAIQHARRADPGWARMLETPGDLVTVLHQFTGMDAPVWAFAFHPYDADGPHVVAIDAFDGTPLDWTSLYLGTTFSATQRDVVVDTVQATPVDLPVYSGAGRAKLLVTANDTPPLAEVRMEIHDPDGQRVEDYNIWPLDVRFGTTQPTQGDWRLVLRGSGVPAPTPPSVVVHWCVDGRVPDPLGVAQDLEETCDDL